jgi:tellurite resistance protein TerC
MYFLLAGMRDRFRYLNIGLGVILASVGVKMLLSDVYHVPSPISLAIIIITLAATVLLSMQADKREAREAGS